MPLFHRTPKIPEQFPCEDALCAALPGSTPVAPKDYDGERQLIGSLASTRYTEGNDSFTVPPVAGSKGARDAAASAACVLDLPNDHSLHVVTTNAAWIMAAAPGPAWFPEGVTLFIPKKEHERAREYPDTIQAKRPELVDKFGNHRVWIFLPLVSDDPDKAVAAIGALSFLEREDFLRSLCGARDGSLAAGVVVTRSGVAAAGARPNLRQGLPVDDFGEVVRKARAVAGIAEPASADVIPQ